MTITSSAVGRGQLANDAVRSFAFADGAVGAAAIVRVYGRNINASEVQRRITGRCSIDERIRVIHEDGTVECEPAAASSGCVNETHGIREFYPGEHDLVIPAGVCSIRVELWGGGGGGGGGMLIRHNTAGDPGTTRHGGGGGAGAVVHDALAVTPGESLRVLVGGGGQGGERNDMGLRTGPEHGVAESGGPGHATRVERGGSTLAVAQGGDGGEGGVVNPNKHGAAGVTRTGSRGDVVRVGTPGFGGGDGHRQEARAARGIELFQEGDRGHGGRGGHRGHVTGDPFDDHEAPTDGEPGRGGYVLIRW